MGGEDAEPEGQRAEVDRPISVTSRGSRVIEEGQCGPPPEHKLLMGQDANSLVAAFGVLPEGPHQPTVVRPATTHFAVRSQRHAGATWSPWSHWLPKRSASAMPGATGQRRQRRGARRPLGGVSDRHRTHAHVLTRSVPAARSTEGQEPDPAAAAPDAQTPAPGLTPSATSC